MDSHGVSTTMGVPALRLVAWEVTRSCMLACRHCRAAAEKGPYPGELSTDECMKLLDSLAAMGSCIVILTGGEPMLRPDIYDIAHYGSARGLRMVMAPCGMLLDRAACEKLKEAGIARISLSIQRKFNSGYGLKLYENVARFRDSGSSGWRSVEKWKELLGVKGNAYYREFRRFNNKIIKRAVEEVNEHADIHVTPEYQRQGRSVSAIRFLVTDLKQQSLFPRFLWAPIGSLSSLARTWPGLRILAPQSIG